MFMKVVFLSLFCLASVSVSALDIVKEEFLSPNVEHFDCHSSSIVETSPGSLCAVWKGGPGDGLSNIHSPTT